MYLKQILLRGVLSGGDEVVHYLGQWPKYVFLLEGTAAYGCLLLAPAEGWWPLATWRALRAIFSFRCLDSGEP